MKPDYEQPGVALYRGNALEVLCYLPDGCVDAVITDPPYGMVNRFGVQQQSRGCTRHLEFAWDSPAVAATATEAFRVSLLKCKRTAALFVFCSIENVGPLLDVSRTAGFTVKPAAWVKKCPMPAGKGNWWPSAFELAFYGYRKAPWFGDTDRKRSNVFVADSYRYGQPGKVGHPTQKPLGLMRRIVGAIVPPGGTALDPFMGSGTTGLACLQTGRQFVGVEMDPAYFDMARKRLSEAHGPLFAPQGPEPSLFSGTIEQGT
jgi:site-specific DNA-methyltransferase (adenine-specific)